MALKVYKRGADVTSCAKDKAFQRPGFSSCGYTSRLVFVNDLLVRVDDITASVLEVRNLLIYCYIKLISVLNYFCSGC